MNDETKRIDETALEEERPMKRRGRKPKNALAAEETTATKAQSGDEERENIDYDYLLKVLDDAKRKIERKKGRDGIREKTNKGGFSEFLAYAVPTLFIFALGLQILMLFWS